MSDLTEHRNRRRWPVFIAPGLIVIAALAWSGFWFYAASQVDSTIEGWRAREAQSGRVHRCGSQSVGGFPFRLEVRCKDASITLTAQTAEQVESQTPVVLRFAEILAVAQIYTPNLLIAEFTAPATFAEADAAPSMTATWRSARASVAGRPEKPDQIALVLEDALVTRTNGAAAEPLFSTSRLSLHGRTAEGASGDQPVFEAVLQLDGAKGPDIHPALAAPFDSQVRVLVHGVKDFSPKPWPVRFREVQAAGGKIEIKQARLQQGELISVASGSLGIAANGQLDGQLDLTVAGVDKVLAALGLDKLLGPLSSLIPGGALGMLGKPATLEGKKAVTMPLVFADGAVRLGPLPVARTEPLF